MSASAGRPDANGGLSGSCTCGSSSSALPGRGFEGYCLPQSMLPSAPDRQAMLTCFGGNTYYDNCAASTGQATGVCQTRGSAFGYQANCYCDLCVQHDLRSQQCSPACSGSLPSG